MEDRRNSTENQQMESSQRRENTREANKMKVQISQLSPELSYFGVVLYYVLWFFRGLLINNFFFDRLWREET